MNRAVESDLEECRYYGLGLTTYSVLAGGFLTGKHKRGQGASSETRLRISVSRDRTATDLLYRQTNKYCNSACARKMRPSPFTGN